ncbi:hypothetical protein DV713_00150 [Parageobacillus thermoglucosidasius]|uniref:hypothetical protein n=1 Tax=Parageobacillus thermoglucosidasius TaxID=1426 RepID=UPI000E149DF8|nr:hypothetical protein [Parageobacillus thermoglucosidasius]RDE36641.1 hypothetical protein DV713_00150 [Parageobacillus thermoglucosidasius]
MGINTKRICLAFPDVTSYMRALGMHVSLTSIRYNYLEDAELIVNFMKENGFVTPDGDLDIRKVRVLRAMATGNKIPVRTLYDDGRDLSEGVDWDNEYFKLVSRNVGLTVDELKGILEFAKKLPNRSPKYLDNYFRGLSHEELSNIVYLLGTLSGPFKGRPEFESLKVLYLATKDLAQRKRLNWEKKIRADMKKRGSTLIYRY